MKIKMPLSGKELSLYNCFDNESPQKLASAKSPISPRRKSALEREKLVKKVVRVVSSPIPYVGLCLLFLMVIMIFVDVMPISGLICLVAITMVLFIVIGNHWKNATIWEEATNSSNHHHVTHHQYQDRSTHRKHSTHSKASNPSHHSRNSSYSFQDSKHNSLVSSTHGQAFSASLKTTSLYHQTNEITEESEQRDQNETNCEEVKEVNYISHSKINDDGSVSETLGPLTSEDRIDNLNEFFEELFGSIDYALLLIFLGTFIVVENLTSTGIPRRIW
jgi:hypothetical protein